MAEREREGTVRDLGIYLLKVSLGRDGRGLLKEISPPPELQLSQANIPRLLS